MDFDAVYEDNWTPLFRYVDRMVGDADLAADIVQQTFIRLLGRTLEQTLSEEDAQRWLFTVATNLVRDEARATTRHRRLMREHHDRSGLLPDRLEAPDSALLRSERVTAVRAALAQLSDRDRQLLLMREEGFRYAEIARAVDVAHGSVGTLLGRAMRRFVKALDPRIVRDETGSGTWRSPKT